MGRSWTRRRRSAALRGAELTPKQPSRRSSKPTSCASGPRGACAWRRGSAGRGRRGSRRTGGRSPIEVEGEFFLCIQTDGIDGKTAFFALSPCRCSYIFFLLSFHAAKTQISTFCTISHQVVERDAARGVRRDEVDADASSTAGASRPGVRAVACGRCHSCQASGEGRRRIAAACKRRVHRRRFFFARKDRREDEE